MKKGEVRNFPGPASRNPCYGSFSGLSWSSRLHLHKAIAAVAPFMKDNSIRFLFQRVSFPRKSESVPLVLDHGY